MLLIGLKCLKCKKVYSGSEGLHLSSQCSECGNDDLSQFIRVDDEDIDPVKNKRYKEWLESQRIT